MKTVGFISTPLGNGNAGRGVGFYTQRLLQNLKLIAAESGFQIEENNLSADLVHYPFFDLFTHSLPLLKGKTVVTIHDVIPLEFPEHYPPGIKGAVNLQLQKWSLKDVSLVIADSYASVSGIHKYLNVPHDKIRLIYLAADPIFQPVKQKSTLKAIQTKYKLPQKFVLYVGDVGWNKNIPNLVKATQLAGLPLVIAGKNAANIEKMDLRHTELRHLQNISWDNVLRLGFVPDQDLVALYNLAHVYCQPSFAEGFGLPVLEALACHCPVVCSNTHSLPEIGDSAVSYFDPNDVSQIMEALQHPKIIIRESQTANFSWEKTARETLMVYGEALQ